MSGISTTSGAGTTVQHPISVQIAQGTGQVSASTGGTLVASGVPVAAAGAGGSCETNLGTGGNTGNGGGTQNGGTVLGLCGGVLGSAVSPHLPLMLHPSLLNGGSLGGTSSSLAGSIGTSLQPSSLSGPVPAGAAAFQQLEKEKIYQLVMDLTQSSKREFALLELSKKRESFPDLAPILWHSFGTIAALLQEIVSIYPLLSPPSLTAPSSNRVCNSLALLQCVASHPDTRQLFLNAHIPLFLYPFLNTVSKSRPFEYLRLTSLGVIGALVKVDDPDVINFLLQTEIIPLCLRIMETGSELSKTVGTFILQKILLDDLGLNYICATAERFYAVSTVLSNMVASLVEFPSPRLLKHIIRCYLRLADNCRAREALRQCLPESLKDKTFHACLKDDNGTKRWLMQLLSSISDHSQIPLVQSNQ